MASVLLISTDHDLSERLCTESSTRGWSFTAIEGIPEKGLGGPGLEVVIADASARGVRKWLSDSDSPYQPLTIVIADGASMSEVVSWGVDDFLLKPVREMELVTRVELLLAQPEPEPALPFEGAKTVSFFESLINASADAFVVADMDGQIQLFNRGAERLCGRRSEEVVSETHLSEIFTASSADAVMSRVLAQAIGNGVRSDPMIIDAVAANGDVVPIRLSVAVARQHGEPNAIVLVFSDLRDKFQAEQELAEAQKKIAFADKHSVLAELAGTAAHKLNQPLTSVMAYAELLKQKSEPGSVGENIAGVLLQEADRMADIVKKLGRIARYETTSYVGSQKIFDLDRATESQDSTDAEKGS